MSNNFTPSNTALNDKIQPNNNNTDRTLNDDLPKLGRKKSSGIKKSVSFNNNITITKVENWKKYNKDMSGETEFFKLKKQVEEYKALKAKKLKEQDKCCCIIF